MIKSLSPYYVNTPFISPLTSEQCTEYKLQLYVWNGSLVNVPATPTYEKTILNTDVSSGNSPVNISKLINDFLTFSTNSSTITEPIDGNNQLWVQHDVIYTTTDVLDDDVQQNITTDIMVSGYGYGNEGENPQPPANNILIQGTEFNINRKGFFIVPILLVLNETLPIFNAYEARVLADGGGNIDTVCLKEYINSIL